MVVNKMTHFRVLEGCKVVNVGDITWAYFCSEGETPFEVKYQVSIFSHTHRSGSLP